MIRESVEKLRGMVFTPEELRDVIEPAVKASEGQKYYRSPFERRKEKMREIEKENGETFIEDEVTLRLCFPKEMYSMTKGDIQKILNKYVEDGWRKPTVKPVAYMTSDMLKGVMGYIYEGDLMGAGMTLKSLIKVVDDETMKKVQQLVEGSQPNK